MKDFNFIFAARELSKRERAYTFEDVLLVPCRSAVASRFHVSTKTQWTRRHSLELPVVAANMDTISEEAMCRAMAEIKAGAIMHRFMTVEEQARQVKSLANQGLKSIAASVGVTPDSKDRARVLVEAGAHILTVDIAHGHSESMIEMVRHLKKEFPAVDVIAGNVATPRAAEDLIRAGADALKVGIGPGSMCTTRIITGVGMPQLTAIAICVEAARKEGIPIIADGGIRTSGDAMKALATGASSVMLGYVLSGALETPGELVHGKKAYRGMASRAAQTSWRGGELPEGMAPEGESTLVACKGPAREIVQEFVGGIRSGMSYLNSRELRDLDEFAYFVEVSPNCVRENRAHGVQ